MKKTLFALMLISLAGTAWAQKSNQRANKEVFTLGPRAGINYTALIKDDRRVDSEYRLGYHFGGFLRLSPGRFYIQPEVLLTSKKTDVQVQNTAGTTQTGSYRVSFTSVDVPVLLGAKLAGNRSNLRVFAGPMASFNVSGRGLEDVIQENESARDYYEKTVWGFQAGAGVDLGALTFDARYERGFTAAANLERANLGKPATGLFLLTLGIKLL